MCAYAYTYRLIESFSLSVTASKKKEKEKEKEKKNKKQGKAEEQVPESNSFEDLGAVWKLNNCYINTRFKLLNNFSLSFILGSFR